MPGGRSKPTTFHWICEDLLLDCKPPTFDVQAELRLGSGPPRADFLLLRRREEDRRGDLKARVLRRLWPMLPSWTVVEYKSPGRPIRRGDAFRLLGYGGFFAGQTPEMARAGDLALVVLVSGRTPTLDLELDRLGWEYEPIGDGYYQMNSAPFRGFVVAADEVAEAERDELLALVSDSRMGITTDEAFQWFLAHVVQGPRAGEMQRLEGYDAALEKALARLPVEKRLQGLKPEERLHGLKPEERLRDLSPEEQVLALSDDVLAGLSAEYLRSLPPAVRRKIQRRLKAH